MRDVSPLKEDLERKITTCQREVDLKLVKSVWGAHVRTPDEDGFPAERESRPPGACLCCNRPPETVERDLLYAYQGLKDSAEDTNLVEDHLLACIHQEARVKKNHCHVFLGGLDPGQATPKTPLFFNAEAYLSIFISL